MPTAHIAPLLAQAERRAIISALREHPRWTLGELSDHIERGGAKAHLLRDLRLEELLTMNATVVVGSPSGVRPAGKGVHLERLEAARQASGEYFDAFVSEVLGEAAEDPSASGGWVGASFLRERVGGPRWKLQASLARLLLAGLVERRGKTSSTRYRRRVSS